MRTGKRAYWGIGLLIGVVAIFWFLARKNSHQLSSVYLNAGRRIAAAGSKPVPPAADAQPPLDPQHLVAVLPVGAAVLVEVGHTWSVVPSNAASAKNSGPWQPGKSDIAQLEASLGQVSSLKAKNWPMDDPAGIVNPANYYRQYVGVRRNNKKLIYVNAFCQETADGYPPPDWRQHLVQIQDGGTCVWQRCTTRPQTPSSS